MLITLVYTVDEKRGSIVHHTNLTKILFDEYIYKVNSIILSNNNTYKYTMPLPSQLLGSTAQCALVSIPSKPTANNRVALDFLELK